MPKVLKYVHGTWCEDKAFKQDQEKDHFGKFDKIESDGIVATTKTTRAHFSLTNCYHLGSSSFYG